MLIQVPATRGAAGFPLEDRINDVFPRGGQWEIQALKANPPGPKFTHWKNDTNAPIQYLHFGYQGELITIHEHPLGDSATFKQLPVISYKPGTTINLIDAYYVPNHRNQATMDAFLFESAPKIGTVIQTTTSLKRHGVNKKGFTWLQSLGVVKFRYIVVAIPDSSIDLPFPNSFPSGLIVEKYIVVIKSLPIPT
jgi:hypothetical protein